MKMKGKKMNEAAEGQLIKRQQVAFVRQWLHCAILTSMFSWKP